MARAVAVERPTGVEAAWDEGRRPRLAVIGDISCDVEGSVEAALAKLPGYPGVTGDMKFQEGSGDPIKSAVILQVKGGKFVYVTNAQP